MQTVNVDLNSSVVRASDEHLISNVGVMGSIPGPANCSMGEKRNSVDRQSNLGDRYIPVAS